MGTIFDVIDDATWRLQCSDESPVPFHLVFTKALTWSFSFNNVKCLFSPFFIDFAFVIKDKAIQRNPNRNNFLFFQVSYTCLEKNWV